MLSLNQIKQHSKVDSVSDERGAGDGIWVYLKKGYIWDGEVHCVHEQTVKEVNRAMKDITVCTCNQCTK